MVERLAATGYVVIVVSALFGGQGRRGRILLHDLPEPRGRRTLSVVVAEAKREVGANCEEVEWIEDK